MSYSSIQSTSGELFDAGTNSNSLYQRLVHWVQNRVDLYQAEYELRHMSDLELSDIGLNRGEIHNAVRHGRFVA